MLGSLPATVPYKTPHALLPLFGATELAQFLPPSARQRSPPDRKEGQIRLFLSGLLRGSAPAGELAVPMPVTLHRGHLQGKEFAYRLFSPKVDGLFQLIYLNVDPDRTGSTVRAWTVSRAGEVDAAPLAALASRLAFCLSKKEGLAEKWRGERVCRRNGLGVSRGDSVEAGGTTNRRPVYSAKCGPRELDPLLTPPFHLPEVS